MGISKLDIFEKEILELYYQGFSDEKIGKKFQVNGQTVGNWRYKMKLPPASRKPVKNGTLKSSIVNPEKFEELYNQGLNDRKISQILGVNNATVFRFRNSLSLKPVEQYARIELTDFQYEVLLGHTLGDGHLVISQGSVNASGNMTQCLAQKEYFLWKYNILEPLTNHKYREDKRWDKRTEKYYYYITTSLLSHPILTELYKITYINGVKELNRKNLERFSAVSLATLFMDDGCIRKREGYELATNCFSNESIAEFRAMLFYRFGLNSCTCKEHKIYILQEKSARKFEELVSPYIIPSMRYKLHID